MPCKLAPGGLQGMGGGTTADNLDILHAALSLLVKAALLTVRFSGRVRR
jgi:hypothetical protein